MKLKYIQVKGTMVIIVTHRVDIARRYVDKHYHIGEDGVMKEEKNELSLYLKI